MKLSITVPITYILGAIAEAAIVFSGGMSTPLTFLSLALVAWVCLWTHLTATIAVRQYILKDTTGVKEFKEVLGERLQRTQVIKIVLVPKLPFGFNLLEQDPVEEVRYCQLRDDEVQKTHHWMVRVHKSDREKYNMRTTMSVTA